MTFVRIDTAKLKEAREGLQMTCRDAAVALLISTPAYWNIEKGYRNTTMKLAKRISSEFGIDLDELILERWEGAGCQRK